MPVVDCQWKTFPLTRTWSTECITKSEGRLKSFINKVTQLNWKRTRGNSKTNARPAQALLNKFRGKRLFCFVFQVVFSLNSARAIRTGYLSIDSEHPASGYWKVNPGNPSFLAKFLTTIPPVAFPIWRCDFLRFFKLFVLSIYIFTPISFNH